MKKTRKKVKLHGIDRLLITILVLLVVSSPIVVVYSKSVLSESNIELERMKKKIDKQESINESINMKINELASLSNIQDVAKEFGLKYQNEKIAIVAPDHGALHRARDLSNFIPNTNIVVIDKRRPRPNVAEITNIVGDIEGKICVMVDDIIDTGGTILAGAKALHDKGAKEIYICASHALFNGPAFDRFNDADYVTECCVTDTIEHPEIKDNPKIVVVSIAEMIADVIRSHESHEKIKDEYARFH